MTTVRARLAETFRSNLPRQRLAIESNLAPAVVIESLRAATVGERWWPSRSQTDKTFRGVVGDGDFRLVRAITYLNSFLPIIEGRVEVRATGSRLTATLRLHRFVAAFAVFWFGFLTLFTALVVTAVVNGGTSGWAFLALLPFSGFAILLITSFRSEARRARVLLEAVAAASTLLTPAEDWFESANNLAWRDVRRAGWLGYIALLSYPVTMSLALLTWFRRPGCGNREALDPTIYCPAGWRTLSVWGIFAGVMCAAFLGSVALRRRRRLTLVLAIAYNVAAIAVLVWILNDSAFFPHRR